jgi:hypothetical protein
MTWTGRGVAAKPLFAFAVLAHSGAGLTGEDRSSCAGLEALHAVGRGVTFCRFGALSSIISCSCPCSFLES